MDGNGRWAESRGLPRVMGHRAGVEALKSTLRLCSDWGISALTAYAFSTENWSRPGDEVNFLMTLFERVLQKELRTLEEEQVRIRFLRPNISTLCVGQAASMGSLLLAAGEPGMRFSLPNSRIMVHQPSGGFQGQASDIELQAKEIIELKKRLNLIYVKHCGQKLDKVESSLDRDNFMAPSEALSWGIVDEIIETRVEESEE